MKEGESKKEFSWITEEIANQIIHRDKIVKEQDMVGLFQLTDNVDFSIALYEILSNQCDYNPENLNPTQRTLFLCMLLENAGQADHILGFLQDEFSNYANEAVTALDAIGATKSAEIIKHAILLLPQDGSCFFDTADENSLASMSKLDREFSSYPDGLMHDLYRKYAEGKRSNL